MSAQPTIPGPVGRSTSPRPSGVADDALGGGRQGADHLQPLLTAVLKGLADGAALREGPVPADDPRDHAVTIRTTLGNVLPQYGIGAIPALEPLTRMLAQGAADPADPSCAAHLHCPPLAVAVAADLAVSALNPSLDSWDQAPAATTLETEVIKGLAGLAGYHSGNAGGVLTGGATESNLMGMLLARNAAVRAIAGRKPGGRGLTGHTGNVRIFCSEMAHFSVQRNAALLGLGAESVVTVGVDEAHRMDVTALTHALDHSDGVPAAIIATAGTTDLGAIDPLFQLAEIAQQRNLWLHTDAAYGGGALFSDRLAPLLDGLGRSHSVALDLHKLGWQPVASGVFLTRESQYLAPLARRVAYLNPVDDEEAGYSGLLGNSLRTTRRADAFKIAVTMRALGKNGLGRLVDNCHDLANYAAERIVGLPALQLAARPVLTSVVFRYRDTEESNRTNRTNTVLRRKLLRAGRAVLGRTEIEGSVWLKLTLLNPHATRSDIDGILDEVIAAGAEVSR